MIVKDEAAVVGEALASLAPHIADYIVVDTGSGDGTQAVIAGDMAARGIKGQVFERPWRDFGWNRSEALALAREHSALGLPLDVRRRRPAGRAALNSAS